MATIRELAALPELRIAVLTDPVALDREVRWAHVTELEDPSPYLRAGELVLTNGIWLAGNRGIASYVRAVADSGACGLLFGLLAERPAVPDGLVDACRAAGVPLLTLAIEVPFAAVTEALAALQAAERQHELLQSVSRGDALVQAVARGAHETDVLALLTRDHQLPVALVDHAGQIMAHDGLAPEALDVDAILGAIDGPRRAEVALADGRPAAIYAVEGLGAVEALLVCGRSVVELTPAERAALAQTARFITLEVTRRQALAAVEARFAGELIEMVLDATRRGHEVPGRLRSFALDPDGPLVAVSVAFADEGTPTASGLSTVVGRFWLQRGAAVVVPQGTDDALAVVAWPHDPEALAEVAEALVATVVGAWPRRRAVAGVGRVADGHAGLRRSLLEAREARRAAQRRRRGSPVMTFHHVGSHRVLLGLQEQTALEEFTSAVLGPLREHDRAHGSDLERTLTAFLAGGGRWSVTADALHVHVNTLRNRLRRIEELTGRDLQSTEDRVDFHLALHAFGD
ncbi:Purine catabolism regulatory protein [Baekduia alba]|uniref:PucR family transcriptional regulator n=1 Tax=Baekduia alba TaxID=2997333 RepID=UPI0023411688|nr:PucR family transcriptional regulator [Baekduia alba]WCB96722.1 Purine catabolism regulatory protein [Baekduia alba]